MNVAKLTKEELGEEECLEEAAGLRLAVFPGAETLLERFVSLLEAGGMKVVRASDTRVVPVLGSHGESATYVIEVTDLGNPPAEAPAVSRKPWSLAEAEAAHIRRVLELCNENRTKAAVALGIARSTLIRKLQEIEVRERHG